MTIAEQCTASEYADILERSAAKFRSTFKSAPPCEPAEQHERFEGELAKELQKERERRTAARA